MTPHTSGGGTDAERRAYREGRVDSVLNQHDVHLTAINGSQERQAIILEQLHRAVDKIGDQVTGLLLVMPKIQTAAEQAVQEEETAARVAAALKQKTADERNTWEYYRNAVAWAVGGLGVILVTANLVLRLLGVGAD